MMMEGAQDIVVTSARVTNRQFVPSPVAAPPPPPPPPPPEDVGDLKLYRVPVTVDVAAKAQKQVALLRQADVKAERLYVANISAVTRGAVPMTLRLRLQNRKSDGLGLAMPSGRVALFEDVGGMRLLAGEADIGDKAEGERVDYDLAASPDVRIVARMTAQSTKTRDWSITISNARPFAVTAEVAIAHAIDPRPTDMERRGNEWIWRVTIPANDKVEWNYVQRLPR
jgi:hypothetical protein